MKGHLVCKAPCFKVENEDIHVKKKKILIPLRQYGRVIKYTSFESKLPSFETTAPLTLDKTYKLCASVSFYLKWEH